MTTKIEVVPVTIVKPRFSWPLALAILALGLIVAVFAATLPTTAARIAGQPVERNQASRQQAIEADATRYTSLGLFYTAGNEASPQQAIEADAARYNSMAEFYGAGTGPQSLARPPRPAQFQPSEWGRTLGTVLPIAETEINADQDIGLMEFFVAKNGIVVPATDNALTEYHQSEWGRIPSGVSRAEDALAVYHQSERAFVPIVTSVPQLHNQEYGLARFDIPGNETRPLAWPPRPTQFHPAENAAVIRFQENALAVYHTSEWERAPQTIETGGANGDIGLMEFFTIRN
jgi:hypothetical protein